MSAAGVVKLAVEAVVKRRRRPEGGSAEVLRGVSLGVPAGEITAIVGPSGGGKSTLVRLLNRLEDPDAGRILLDGADIAVLDPLRLRRRVGLVLQQPFMFPGSVLDNLQRPFLLRGERPPEEGAPELREALGLCRLEPTLLEREARSLSVGQQQRLALARALVTAPEVLALDEPTSALDRPTGDRLADTLHSICLARRLTVVMVTHDLRLAGRVADRLAYLEAGRVLEEGAAVQLLAHPGTEALRAFLAEPPAEEV